jgi:hypothetical protein
MKSLFAKKVRFQHKLQNIIIPKGETIYGNVNKLRQKMLSDECLPVYFATGFT